MRVTINLAKGSGRRELVEVLRAADAVIPRRKSILDPVDLLTDVIQGAVTRALKGLERIIHRRVCRYITRQKGVRLLNRCLKLQQELLAWLRITPGRVAVKP